MESKQYQFRAKPETEALLQKVWNPSLSNTENLIKIIHKGVEALLAQRRIK